MGNTFKCSHVSGDAGALKTRKCSQRVYKRGLCEHHCMIYEIKIFKMNPKIQCHYDPYPYDKLVDK